MVQTQNDLIINYPLSGNKKINLLGMGEYNNSTIILTIQVYHVTKKYVTMRNHYWIMKKICQEPCGSVALIVGWIPHVPIIVTIELSTKKKG